jgi:hypothetical protein
MMRNLKQLEKRIEKMDVKYRTPICGTALLMPYQILELLKEEKAKWVNQTYDANVESLCGSMIMEYDIEFTLV